MAAMDKTKKSTFFWQGMLIMLPVVVLAAVSLALVHRDEQATQQEARDRAAQSAQALARAVLNSALPEIEAFGKLEASSKAADEWRSKYPTLKIEDVALPPCVITESGQIIKPAGFDGVPEPPRWFLALSPQQAQLWRALSEAGPDTVEAAYKDFIQSGPPSDAVLAAKNILVTAGIGQDSDHPEIPTESGVSFGDVYCFRQLTAGGPLTQELLNRLRNQVLDRPSFVSPSLLDLAERATNGATPEVQGQLRALRHHWQMQSTARELLKTHFLGTDEAVPSSKLERAASSSPTNQAFWLKIDSAQALALLTRSEAGWNVALVSRPVVEAAFARALAENRFILPTYATAMLALDDELLQPAATNAPVLARAAQTSPDWPLHLSVGLYLTDRAQFLSAERRHAGLLGSLVAGTVVTALIGLFVARRAFYQQLRLNEMKSNFVSAVSHELRAPIASVRLLAEGLDRGKITEPQKQKEYFHFIVQECRRLSSLIGNVLDFSRIDQGRKKYEFEPANLVALVEQTVALMTPAATERQVQLIFPHDPALSLQLTCDGLAIQQALINLIDNAIKHSPGSTVVTVGVDVAVTRMEGAAPASCDCRCNQKEVLTSAPRDQIHLWVEDQGPGIPPEEHEKIFERFYRRGSELRRETQGIGIGLTIVKHIVEAHGGRARVRSAVGQGSRFTMELVNQNGKG